MTASAVDRLRRALAIDRPILGAPMARIADADLANAVTAADGLGFLGGGYGDHRWLLDQFASVDPSTVGVGLITWRLDEHGHDCRCEEAAILRGPQARLPPIAADPSPSILLDRNP
jgi:nitronate monooxygenase